MVTRVQQLNKTKKNWVDVYKSLWTGHKNLGHGKFLKKIRVEHRVMGRRINPETGKTQVQIGKHIHVTGDNFGMTLTAEQATVLSQLLALAVEDLKKE